MRARPDLVGGATAPDTLLMRACPGVVAKRGAEGVLAAGTAEGLGVAVKISDGAARATLPVLASALRAEGANVPDELLTTPVLGGGTPHGQIEVEPPVSIAASSSSP